MSTQTLNANPSRPTTPGLECHGDGDGDGDGVDWASSLGLIGASSCYIVEQLESARAALYNVFTEFTWSVEMECIEVYNERLRDVLECAQSGKVALREVESKRYRKVTDRHGAAKRGSKIFKTVLEGTTRRRVRSVEEVERVLAVAARKRTADSHLVVRVVVKTLSGDTGKETVSTLQFVDFAGSDNAKGAGCGGAVRKKQVDRSLSALSGVIDAMIKVELTDMMRTHGAFRASQVTVNVKVPFSNNIL